MNQYPIETVNRLISSKYQLYTVLTESSDFSFKLPSYHSKAITITYLINVANGQVFAIKKTDYKENFKKSSLNKIDYFVELGKLVNNLGFGIESLPDKRWLRNALFSINPDHEFFSNQPSNIVELNQR